MSPMRVVRDGTPPRKTTQKTRMAKTRFATGPAATIARVEVKAEGVALPDLDQSARKRPAIDADHAAFQMKHLAHGARLLAADLYEVVVGVGGQAGRIERPLGLRRCGHRVSGKGG